MQTSGEYANKAYAQGSEYGQQAYSYGRATGMQAGLQARPQICPAYITGQVCASSGGPPQDLPNSGTAASVFDL